MKEEIYNEMELKAMEEEIRSYGIPYSKNEPDERYFTNFRVHLMERIEAKEKKQNFFAAAWSWISGSAIRSISIGATLAAVVVAALLMNQSPKTEIARVQYAPPTTIEKPAVIAPVQVAPEIKKEVAVIPKVIAKPKTLNNTELADKANEKNAHADVNAASDFAELDESLTGSESDDPVNYESLSESELESVVTVAQSMK